MAAPHLPSDLARRLPWLLVFRAAVATALLALTLVIDLRDSSLRAFTGLLYGVVAGTYLVVAVLGLLLRARVSPVLVSSVHLGTAVVATLMVVQATGGIESILSFLYLLVILDAAIIGGGRAAMFVASACSLAYGGQLTAQLYGYAGIRAPMPEPSEFVANAVAHVAGFLMMALLAGYLAELLQRAREAVRTAETHLLRVERLHGAVLESLPVGVVTCSETRMVITTNQAAARLLGTPLGALIGAPLPPPLDVLLDRLVKSGETLAEMEVELGGATRQLLVGRSPLAIGEGTLARLEVLVLEDRTGLRALERDLQAKERLASIGELAAAIAHEIRNPLAAISGSVELLASSNEAGKQEQLRSIVLREIARLNRLVQDFLIYARPAPPEKMSVDLAAMAGDLREVLRQDPIFRGHEVRVTTNGAAAADVDPGQMRQVLWNLLRNAVEASPAGTPVEVAVAATAAQLVIEVRDRGAGIDPAIQKHLFEPFRTTKPSGSGLGLATVHRIVQAHRGTIDVRSEPGSGTTVRVALPRGAV